MEQGPNMPRKAGFTAINHWGWHWCGFKFLYMPPGFESHFQVSCQVLPSGWYMILSLTLRPGGSSPIGGPSLSLCWEVGYINLYSNPTWCLVGSSLTWRCTSMAHCDMWVWVLPWDLVSLSLLRVPDSLCLSVFVSIVLSPLCHVLVWSEHENKSREKAASLDWWNLVCMLY